MLDYIFEKLKNFFSSRLLPISIVYIVLFFVLIQRIFTLQIVQGNEDSLKPEEKNTQTREIKSTRGNIYDRNGVLLAYNELSYSVVIEDNSTLSGNEEKNNVIYKLIQLIEHNGDEIDVDFPIVIDDSGEYQFNVSGSALARFKKTAYSGNDQISAEEIDAATAKDMFDYLRHGIPGAKMFDISDDYTTEEALQIMAIRYAIYSNYPKYLQITVATQVSAETVAAVKENSRTLVGVTIKQESYRVYNDSFYFSHILGYTGRISSEELAEKESEGLDYNSTDYIGKSGVEQVYETYLAGTKGSEKVTVNNLNKVVSIDETKDPVAGNDLYLTIDAELQKAAYHVLENKIAGILVKKIVNSTSSKGKTESDILIPIYDVYYALINNNVIDITEFRNSDATNLEQSVYAKYQNEFNKAIGDIRNALDSDFTTPNDKVNKNLTNYLTYIYEDVLLGNKVLVSKSIDKEDETYKGYINNNVSLSQFLQYAISNNWMDLAKLNVGDQYYSTDEIYQMLVDYLCEELIDDSKFNKMIYHNLIYNFELTGKEICLLLFDQGVLEYNEEDINKLQNNYSPYTFILNKIRNLEITPGQLALDPCSGSVVITDPDTGEVLALVSYPSYDNNKMANKVDSAYYAKLQSDLATPLYNKATQARSAPGSTFKMVSSIAALSEGVIGVNDTILDLHTFTKLDHGPKCWKQTSHGKENVVRAIRDSCNYYFYEVAWRMGNGNIGNYSSALALSTLKKYATMFGFDSTTGIEIGENEPQISYEDGVRSSIGQGKNNFAPVQLARYVSTLANGGTLYNLTLLDKIEDKDGNTILNNKPVAVGDLTGVNRTYWNAVLEGMYDVVNDTSSKELFKDLPVKVAGKTGTAQEDKTRPNHGLFVSYAPFEDPQIAVTVTIRNGYASANAAEVASEIYAYRFGDLSLEDIMKDGASLNNTSTNTVD